MTADRQPDGFDADTRRYADKTATKVDGHDVVFWHEVAQANRAALDAREADLATYREVTAALLAGDISTHEAIRALQAELTTGNSVAVQDSRAGGQA